MAGWQLNLLATHTLKPLASNNKTYDRASFGAASSHDVLLHRLRRDKLNLIKLERQREHALIVVVPDLEPWVEAHGKVFHVPIVLFMCC